MTACLQPADYEAVDSQIREMDASEGSGNAAFSPLEPLTLEVLRQARTLMLRTLLHNRSVRPELHTHVLFYGVGRGGVHELSAILMPSVGEFAQRLTPTLTPTLTLTKVAVLCHSMGGSVWLYFQQWLLSPRGAALSSAWLDENVERVVLIGAPLLGTPKVIAGMLMGASH